MSTHAPMQSRSTTIPTPTRPWAAVVVIAVAQLMIALDATVVNIALPSAQQALGFSDENRQWVITAEGRANAIGRWLSCVKCDAGAPPDRRT